MTFAAQLRDIQSRANHSTEPGRILAELAGAIADQVEATTPAAPAADPEADAKAAKIKALQDELAALTGPAQA